MFTNQYIISSCVISNNTVYKNGERLFVNQGAEVSAFLPSVYRHFELNYPRFYKMDSLSKLGWLASEILIKDSFNKENYPSENVGVILFNNNSSLDSDLKYMASVADIPSPALFVYTLPNIMIGEICIRNNFKGEDAFFVSEIFDAQFMVNYVNDLFNSNILKACICGWVELLGNGYKACLFLVEKGKGKITFDKEQVSKIFDMKIEA